MTPEQKARLDRLRRIVQGKETVPPNFDAQRKAALLKVPSFHMWAMEQALNKMKQGTPIEQLNKDVDELLEKPFRKRVKAGERLEDVIIHRGLVVQTRSPQFMWVFLAQLLQFLRR